MLMWRKIWEGSLNDRYKIIIGAFRGRYRLDWASLLYTRVQGSANLVRVGEEAARFLLPVDKAEMVRPLRECLFKNDLLFCGLSLNAALWTFH